MVAGAAARARESSFARHAVGGVRQPASGLVYYFRTETITAETTKKEEDHRLHRPRGRSSSRGLPVFLMASASLAKMPPRPARRPPTALVEGMLGVKALGTAGTKG